MRADRWQGRLDLHAAAPTPYGIVVPARVAAVMTLALTVIPIALATAWLTYGIEIDVQHPWLLAVTMVLISSGCALCITAPANCRLPGRFAPHHAAAQPYRVRGRSRRSRGLLKEKKKFITDAGREASGERARG